MASKAHLEKMIAHYVQLKQTVQYNTVMYEHYKKLFNQFRYSWHFVRATYAFVKMVHYEKQMYQAMIADMLNEVNQNSHVPVSITD
jgi:hypothetical protein